MEAKPVQQISLPCYPQREQAIAEEQVLENHVPPCWRRLGSVVGLLVAANLSGCAGVPKDSTQNGLICRPGQVVEGIDNCVESIMEPFYPMVTGSTISASTFRSEELMGYRQTKY